MTKLLENSLGYFQTCQIGNSKSRVGLLSLLEEKENYTMEEVFGDIDNELFTLEEALSYLEITESEFEELLISGGHCVAGEFKKSQKYKVKLIQSLDTKGWMLDEES